MDYQDAKDEAAKQYDKYVRQNIKCRCRACGEIKIIRMMFDDIGNKYGHCSNCKAERLFIPV